MRKLSTIQKLEKLNDVYAIDEPGAGGANHAYVIVQSGFKPNANEEFDEDKVFGAIKMQNGPRKEDASIHGTIDGDLLEIVRDRLKSFQAGAFSSQENAYALAHVEEALMWLNKRVEDRIERNVLGKNIL